MYNLFKDGFDLIIFFASVIFIGALFVKFLDTKAGKIINKIKQPIMKWYENLPYTPRNIVGWFSLAFYCLGLVAIFIWLES